MRAADLVLGRDAWERSKQDEARWPQGSVFAGVLYLVIPSATQDR
jgi:hypothetical protein